ncbi:MAG: TIGR04283 family arsenosugar biosynthesis glycosyltransferase [Betaproteobacteria bacterium]|nr:TIGR04283 family arsenosugar biosynthesis glycosyltransferase [Betaproteobacteria bacterium]
MLNFSVIIPCYRDEEELECLITQLHSLPSKPYEILVVDGAVSKTCRVLCHQRKVRWLASEPCRGQQLLSGAASAQGDVLWFLHADIRLPSDPLSAMWSVIKQGAIGGYFRFSFDKPRDWPVNILEPAIALRCRIGVPYGDQGLFIVRKFYHQAGGHAPWPLFEEVPLVRSVRKLGEFSALRAPVFVNPRRWQHDGWWRRTWHNRKLALNFALGVAPQKLAESYHINARSQIL